MSRENYYLPHKLHRLYDANIFSFMTMIIHDVLPTNFEKSSKPVFFQKVKQAMMKSYKEQKYRGEKKTEIAMSKVSREKRNEIVQSRDKWSKDEGAFVECHFPPSALEVHDSKLDYYPGRIETDRFRESGPMGSACSNTGSGKDLSVGTRPLQFTLVKEMGWQNRISNQGEKKPNNLDSIN
ncbi:hypothetical protein C0J52_12749 [Blattella germanica]|nr:hypothetical protein C0J52_12749 [Blattella germanica]